jgi:hypothetical protein
MQLNTTNERTSTLHAAIMNIPALPPEGANINQILSYKSGHRDARQAAADLAPAVGTPVADVVAMWPNYNLGVKLRVESRVKAGDALYLAPPTASVRDAEDAKAVIYELIGANERWGLTTRRAKAVEAAYALIQRTDAERNKGVA